jgi:TolA-binding protein
MNGRTTTMRPRRALVVAALLAGLAGRAPTALATPDGDRATALLATLDQGDAAGRDAAIKELLTLGGRAQTELVAFLARPHATTVDVRRKVLAAIKASVPDKAGHFSNPGQLKESAAKADDELDWLAALAALPPTTPGLAETLADIAAIRALAAAGDDASARAILDVGFAPDTMIYRDECGRRLRAMAPQSIPALTLGSQAKGEIERRYATYQLERLDRQEPSKALAAAAGDEALRVAILDAFRVTHHREAVHAVLAAIDDESPRVRTAARAAWMAYVTGDAPPPAPRKHLQLPGGKQADKATPLWLTYRDLADNDLRKASQELFGEDLTDAKDVDLEALSKRVFAYYDDLRSKRDQAVYAAAKAKADAGDLAAAAQVFDQLLAANPERPERAEMAGYFYHLGKTLEDKQAWRDAATAYSKAAALDPSGTRATDAQAGRDFALGKALEADGKDGGAAFRRAAALRPNDPAARQAADKASPDLAGPPWFLYGAIAAAGLALLFFVVGLARRRPA